MLYYPVNWHETLYVGKALLDDIEAWAGGEIISRQRRVNYYLLMIGFGEH